MRARRSSLAAHPGLIGAAAILLAIVATVLAYNANSGLPFVATYDLRAEFADSRQLVTGDDVRIAGKRVGSVVAIDPVLDGDRPIARATLRLDRDVAELPADTTARIRPRGVIGAKFVELVPGRSRRTLPAGGTIAVTRTSASLDLQDLNDTFDRATRRGFRTVVRAMSDGLAGRGQALGDAIDATPVAARRAATVLAALADPRTDLRGLLRHGAGLAEALAPVAGDLAATVGHLARIADAIVRERRAWQSSLVELPATLRATRTAARRLTPILAEARALVVDARPAVARLPRALRALDGALVSGTPVLRRVPALAGRVDRALVTLGRVADDRPTADGLGLLAPLGTRLSPLMRWLTPLQTRCNGVGLFFKGTTGITSEGDRYGNWYQMLPVLPLPPPLRVGAPDAETHASTYADPSEGCPIGNERYLPGQWIGRTAGSAPARNPTTPWTGGDR